MGFYFIWLVKVRGDFFFEKEQYYWSFIFFIVFSIYIIEKEKEKIDSRNRCFNDLDI